MSIAKNKNECKTIANINYLRSIDYFGLVCPLESQTADPIGELIPLGTRFPEPFGAVQNYSGSSESPYLQMDNNWI